MPEWAMYIGGLVRWLVKGCKTKFIDEVEGNLDATWGDSYDFENFIIGVISVVIVLGLINWLVF